ncbi:hypothetical protein HPB52_023135 [Rhipicephalus sanguineus]|uniref:HTH CENPB-type domain-containing protein n=1 Tax=Rhipicephalus sanguineus TaxID=34632 RepID=A0A9D4Q3T1_RHISA|nr:hypothetical protein HPB52_023135 [Rhipicephalus sanguineus]
MKCQVQSLPDPSRKRLRLGDYQQIDSAVLTWFKDVRAQNVPMSGLKIQEKARQFAAILDIADFEASSGWLHRFHQQNAITWQTVSDPCFNPLDQGVIKSVKAHFRKHLVQRALKNLQLKQLTIINNCWRKAGLLQKGEQSEDTKQPRNDGEGNPGELWTEMTDLLAVDLVLFDDYVSSDEAARTSAELTTEDILSTVQDDEGSDDEALSAWCKRARSGQLLCHDGLRAALQYSAHARPICTVMGKPRARGVRAGSGQVLVSQCTVMRVQYAR